MLRPRNVNVRLGTITGHPVSREAAIRTGLSHLNLLKTGNRGRSFHAGALIPGEIGVQTPVV